MKQQRSSHQTLLLRSLTADFSGMVNNPHLSDVQFQVDSGEVLYAHMFVLYARCPQLVEVVHNEGFLVAEDGNLQTRRVLLNDVTGEAVCVFLQYLYAAETHVPPYVLSDVGTLAVRFGVRELITVYGSSPGESQEQAGVDSEDDFFSAGEEEDCENRAENFEELLKSVWVDEDEEHLALLKLEGQEEEDNEKVNEQELEEIYEFAATQYKVIQAQAEAEGGTDSNVNSEMEVIHSVSQQSMHKEIEVFESPSTSSKMKECKERLDMERSQHRSLGQEKVMDISRCEHVKNFSPKRTQPTLHKGAEETDCHSADSRGTPKVVKVSRLAQTLQSEEEEDPWEKLFSIHQLHRAKPESYEHTFSATLGEYCEPSQDPKDIKDTSEAITGKCTETNNSSVHYSSQKDLLPVRRDFCSSPLSNPHARVLPAISPSPQSPNSSTAISRVSSQTHTSPISASKQSRKKNLLQFNGDSFWKDGKQDGVSGLQKIKDVVSTIKMTQIDFKKPKHMPAPSPLGQITQHFSSPLNKEDEIVVLLDSDEEMELEQIKEKSSSGSALEEMEISSQLKYACKAKTPKYEPDPTVDNETHHKISPGPPSVRSELCTDSTVQIFPVLYASSQANTWVDKKLNLNLSSEEGKSHEENSSMDASWLVPGTPLYKNRSCSLQTQVTSINYLRSPKSKHWPKVVVKDKTNSKLATTLVATSPQKGLLTENAVGKQAPPGSPLIESSTGSLPDCPVPLTPHLLTCLSTENSSPSKQWLPHHKQQSETKTDISVVDKEDCEDEQEAAPLLSSGSFLLDEDAPIPVDDDCWNVEDLSPIRNNTKDPESLDCAKTRSPTSGKTETQHDQLKSPTRSLEVRGSTPLPGSPVDNSNSYLCHEASRLSFLNSKVWDDWVGVEEKLPEVLSLSQRLATAAPTQRTPMQKSPEPICHEKQPPNVPITPMPAYSIMETPKLKKELNRFGVRALSKRKMVLKLKEIFQYTHQVMGSDSEDEIPSSQPPPQKATTKHDSQPKAVLRAPQAEIHKTSNAMRKRKPGFSGSSQAVLESSNADGTDGPSRGSRQRVKTAYQTKDQRGGNKMPKGAALSPAGSPAKGSVPASVDGQPFSASQKSAASSVAGSDHSFGSQSSSANEFETCVLASEEEEGIPASQAAAWDAEKLKAVRRYIHSNPALYRRILLYQPLELTELQAELKENGIKISLGKLVDFLDSHCVTFTTARARKEKQQQHGGKKKGRKRY
uniref:Structure-specific endonuclease subunit SLX4 n=1 Tax=Sphenodon punctatus TaxID=8508 RepID=A0A8D0LB04_SPHPU